MLKTIEEFKKHFSDGDGGFVGNMKVVEIELQKLLAASRQSILDEVIENAEKELDAGGPEAVIYYLKSLRDKENQ